MESGIYDSRISAWRFLEDSYGSVNLIVTFQLEGHDTKVSETFNSTGRRMSQLKAACPGFDPQTMSPQVLVGCRCRVELRRNATPGSRYKVLQIWPAAEPEPAQRRGAIPRRGDMSDPCPPRNPPPCEPCSMAANVGIRNNNTTRSIVISLLKCMSLKPGNFEEIRNRTVIAQVLG